MTEKATRFGVIGLVALFLLGLVLLGVQRVRADQRAVAAAALPAEVAGSGAPQAAPSSAPVPESAPADPPKKAETIFVHVVGAVAHPGVYELPAGSRAVDAVTIAGGALPEGQPDALVLSQRLSDGDKLWVPTKAEATAATLPPVAKDATVLPVASRVASPSNGSSSGGGAGAIKVNVNTASATELAKVPGIGPTTAKAIVEYRNAHGRFAKLEDLDNVKGIGPATLQKIRPYLTL